MFREMNPGATRPSATQTTEDHPESFDAIDLLAELDPEKAGSEWVFASIIEPHPTGEPIRHGRLLARDNPTQESIRGLLPSDGELHHIMVRFSRADGALVARPSLALFADAPKAEPTAFETMKAQPQFQFMEMMKETNAHGLALMRFMMEDAREARIQANEMRREEMQSLREMYSKTADTLARIESAKSTSPLESVMGMPMFKAAAGWVTAKAAEFLDDPVAFKAQVSKMAAEVAGQAPTGPGAAAMIQPLIDKALMYMAGQANAKAQMAKAEAKVAEAEAQARKAEAERDAAEAQVRAAEAAGRANEKAAEAVKGAAGAAVEGGTIVVEAVRE